MTFSPRVAGPNVPSRQFFPAFLASFAACCSAQAPIGCLTPSTKVPIVPTASSISAAKPGSHAVNAGSPENPVKLGPSGKERVHPHGFELWTRKPV